MPPAWDRTFRAFRCFCGRRLTRRGPSVVACRHPSATHAPANAGNAGNAGGTGLATAPGMFGTLGWMRRFRPLFALGIAGTWLGCALDFSIGPPAEVGGPDADISALDGGSSPDSAINLYDRRVTHDLAALWDFEEGQGGLIDDRVRTLEPVLDLTIDNTDLATWDKPHALTFRDRTWALSKNAGKKLAETAQKFGIITIEAWVAPALGANDDSAHVVVAMAPTASFGTGTGTARPRAFSLGIAGPARTADAGSLADAATFSAAMTGAQGQSLYGGTPVAALTHLVAVRSGDASLTLYVDAVNVGVLAGAASPVDWPETYPVILGNLFSGDAGFLGDIHLVAIYRAALTAEEVRTNFLAGADPP